MAFVADTVESHGLNGGTARKIRSTGLSFFDPQLTVSYVSPDGCVQIQVTVWPENHVMTNKLKASLLEKLERLKGHSTKPAGDSNSSWGAVVENANPNFDQTHAETPRSESNDPISDNVSSGERHLGEPCSTLPKAQRADGNDVLDNMISRINGLATGSRSAATTEEEVDDDRLLTDDEPSLTDTTVGEEAQSKRDLIARRNAGASSSAATRELDSVMDTQSFFPTEPDTLSQAGLNDSALEELVLKVLLSMGEESGHNIADQIKLPFKLVMPILSRMKFDQLISYRSTTKLNDYICTLTDAGRERARRHSDRCTYFGSAPISLALYRESVAKQSLRHQHPSEADLRRAFSDLMISHRMILRLGAAMNSGKGMFLFGGPGNGKTSIAERVTKAFGEAIWIPRAIGLDGEVIRVFDPTQHELMPLPPGDDLVRKYKIDARWVRIRRPTIVVGGELTMANLELSTNHATGINEAPVQLKSNCGTLVIDDFGRQPMSVTELLNRWIVPLEKRVDYLNLPSGKKVEVPFDQLVVFSTNLEPRDLVDDAFLRRIPYKIEVANPSEEEYRRLFGTMCEKMGVAHNLRAIDYLIEKHYKPQNRPFRCCQPRDLLLQVQAITSFQQRPMELSEENFDLAADSYFSVV